MYDPTLPCRPTWETTELPAEPAQTIFEALRFAPCGEPVTFIRAINAIRERMAKRHSLVVDRVQSRRTARDAVAPLQVALAAVRDPTPPPMHDGDDPELHEILTEGWKTCHRTALEKALEVPSDRGPRPPDHPRGRRLRPDCLRGLRRAEQPSPLLGPSARREDRRCSGVYVTKAPDAEGTTP